MLGGFFGSTLGAMGGKRRGVQEVVNTPPGSLASWEPIDKARLQQFLSSDTGRRLLARWEQRELLSYREQCADAMHAAHSCGRARGFSDGREWLISLSRVTVVQVTSADESGVKEVSSQKDKQPMEGESELLERFSP